MKKKKKENSIHVDLKNFDKFFKLCGLPIKKKKHACFKATLIQTRRFKFNREEANAR
jgi:hypothetical protein